MRKIFLAISFWAMVSIIIAQTYELDAVRFSTHNFSGTSRFTALGGAFASVGSDFANLSHNPAGIGMYRSSVFMITPGVNANNITQSYRDSDRKDSKTKFILPNMGAVFSSGDLGNQKSATIQSSAFGVGVNRMADFNRRDAFSAFNGDFQNSMTYMWVQDVASVFGNSDGFVDFDQFSFETVNAYQTYLVNFDPELQSWTSPIQDSVTQSRFRESTGSKNEIVFSGGFNYLDKLYFGATIGVPILRYETDTRFIERDFQGANPDFTEFELTQRYRTNGLGVNFKTGVIYRVNEVVRIGAAIHTPERMSMNERFSSNIDSRAFNTNWFYRSPTGEFDYTIRMPWRGILGASFFMNQRGFFSLDYEAVDYSSIRYTFSPAFQEIADGINMDIRNKYRVAHNIRAGFEGVLNNFRLRAGYNYIGSPLKNIYSEGAYDYSQHRISGGWGVVGDRVAFDMAVQYAFSKEYEMPYRVAGQQVAPVLGNVNNLLFMFTLAYRINNW
jgi:long-subunit fatty acid transport protein